MNWKQKLFTSFFRLFPGEKNTVFALLLIAFGLVFVNQKLAFFFPKHQDIESIEKVDIQHDRSTYKPTSKAEQTTGKSSKPKVKSQKAKAHVVFNLNSSSDVKKLKQIGVSSKLITAYQNELAKAKFNCLSELWDIKGMSQKQFELISKHTDSGAKTCPELQLNQATAKEIKDFFRCSDKTAQTMVNFRKSLGAFVDVEQLKSVYGLSKYRLNQARLKRIKISSPELKKLSLSHTELNQLKTHPYITHSIVKQLKINKEKRTLAELKMLVKPNQRPFLSFYFED
ncbi:MAG: helix-hairpin-helix domain-containing protein [Flavobacteriales bacterium]